MKDLPKRTKKDEDDYNAQLRREEDIKTEIIVALRQQLQLSLESGERTLTALIQAQDSLQRYRAWTLQAIQNRLKHSDHTTIPGIEGVYWDDVDGWHRKDEGTK